MPRLQNISKYWVSCRSAAAASLNVYSMLTPSSGACWMLLTIVGAGRPPPSRSGGGVVERVQHADAFERRLLDAVDDRRRRKARRLEDRRRDVDHVMEL